MSEQHVTEAEKPCISSAPKTARCEAAEPANTKTLDVVARVRAAVREGWEEVREVLAANPDLVSYCNGLRSGSNTVAAYVYRALHDERGGNARADEIALLCGIDGAARIHSDKLREILEAVRALKPAPLRRVFMTAAGPIEVQASEQPETGLLEEIERLQKVIANDALTIAALRDELAYQKNASVARMGEREAAELKRFREREADLEQMFRRLLAMGEHYGWDEEIGDAIAAVRDFEVTP